MIGRTLSYYKVRSRRIDLPGWRFDTRSSCVGPSHLYLCPGFRAVDANRSQPVHSYRRRERGKITTIDRDSRIGRFLVPLVP
jgi:hypothetical protein